MNNKNPAYRNGRVVNNSNSRRGQAYAGEAGSFNSWFLELDFIINL